MNRTSNLDPRVYGAYSKAPTSYKDPAYRDLISEAEQSVGIPSGMLAATVYAGERSNNNQVSPVGAKTMFQFMPKTREYIKQKYGFDAYASPYEGAMAAASLLKENQQTLSKYTNDPTMVVAAYNTGAGNIIKHLTEGKPLAKETQGYISRTSQALGTTPRDTLQIPASIARPTTTSVPTSNISSELSNVELQQAPSLLDTLNAFSEGKNQAEGVKQDVDTSLATLFHNTPTNGGMLKSLANF